jgi:DNA-binding SARP family transcriptional activator/tetratricopeptide (TPR) repeat protein
MTVSRSRERAVLATLLLHANEVVLIDDLVEALWGALSPPSAEMTVRNYVKRLRQVLGEPGGSRIGTGAGGYLIRVEAGEFDVARFEALAGAARAAARAGRWDQVSRQARAALSLWRGDPLVDAGSKVLADREAPRLAEMRLQVLEACLDADVRSGDHAKVIPELHRLVQMYPLREHLHATLMLALYRCGQQGDALAAYRNVRQVLVAELGVEPGPNLRELHQRILAADPSLAVTEPARATEAAPRRHTPRELPPTVQDFTGRSAELEALTRLLERLDAQGDEAIVISAIGGTAGVGKTALAVQWAHQVAARFPDGQLYVNLRGYDPGQPVPAARALARFLSALGVCGPDIPPEPDARAARYRSMLAGKQMLIVLDNAGSADQVRPLLPGTRTCTVLVTSRDALAGLVARDGATRLDLDVLPLHDAVALLRTLIGLRVDAEPGAAAELAGQCCRLPLALRVAAELAASRPATSLSGLTAELADLRTRLDLLAAGGDPRAQVRTVFSWSYHHLDPDAARTFRLLGLHPGPNFDAYAAAALTGTTIQQARWALDVLTRAHLLSPASSGRYGMHDLLRGYASELANSLDTGQEQHVALSRLLDHYLHTAAAAMDTLFPAERHRRPRIPSPPAPAPPVAEPAAARAWLDGQRAALAAATAHAAAHGWPGHATRLAATLSGYLLNGGHLPEGLAVFSHALSAARRSGDRAAEATALDNIGLVNWNLSRFQLAADHHWQAVALFRAAGERGGEARALANIGLAETLLGHYEQAARHQQEAVVIHRDTGDRLGEARALGSLGLARQVQGRCEEAAGYHQQSLELFRKLGDRQGEGYALARLGGIDLRLGRYQHAAGYLQRALALFQEIVDPGGESEMLCMLGEVHLGLGGYQQAAGNFEQALGISRAIGDPVLEADALNGLGNVLCQTGDAEGARAHHATALRLVSETDSPREQARAHDGLARAYQAGGHPAQARHHWQEALTRYAAIGAPEADHIRAQLAKAGVGGDDGHKPAEEDLGSPASQTQSAFSGEPNHTAE